MVAVFEGHKKLWENYTQEVLWSLKQIMPCKKMEEKEKYLQLRVEV